MCYFYVICVFCLLVVLVRLSVPVQVIDVLERLVSEMTYNVLMGRYDGDRDVALEWGTVPQGVKKLE